MSHMKSISRFGLPALCGGVMVAFFGVVPGPARPVQAAFVEEGKGGPQLLIGRDDDNIGNVAIQAGAAANQSLDRTDIIEGGSGNDVIFGLNGNDVIDGGPGYGHHPRWTGRRSGARRSAEQRRDVRRTRRSM